MLKYTPFFQVSVLTLFLWHTSSYGAGEEVQPQINQQQRQEAMSQQLMPEERRVSLAPAQTTSANLIFPEENPCFTVRQIVLDGHRALPYWLSFKDITRRAEGACLGAKGIQLLAKKVQNSLVAFGYITTRVSVPKQNINRGVLTLLLLPGRMGEIRKAENSQQYVNLFTVWPGRSGDALNLRDLEQGMENVLRLPTVASEMNIIPGEEPGISDVEISWQQNKKWRLDMSIDDSGLESTGRYQGSATLSLDNPFTLSDLIYLSASRELQGDDGKKSRYLAAHYSAPFGYWLAGVTASRNNYLQNIAGVWLDYRYSGETKSVDGWLRRVLHRNATQKTTMTFNVLTKGIRHYLEDTELEIQRRKTAAWRLGLQHEQRLGQGSLLLGASYRQGTRWFNALPAPEERSGRATALGKTVQLNTRFTLPFQIERQLFRYSGSYSHQISLTPLTPQDQFAIGGRWTVRGLDGQRTLSASRGWYVRNEIGWRTPLLNQELYLGVDYGEVSGYSGVTQPGKRLAGSVIGLRGNTFNTGYELFAGTPLSRPEGFTTSNVIFGFSTNWSF